MLAFSLWQSEDCFAAWAFAVDVSFSVTEFISSELKEIAEFFIFRASFGDISRHSPIKYISYKEHCRHKINDVK